MTRKRALALLLAGTALGAAGGVSAWSAVRDRPAEPGAAAIADGADRPIVLASGDDDDRRGDRNASRHDDGRHQRRDASRHDDDDDDDDDDDCDDDDCRGNAAAPAPAGTVAPPQNGLFGNGAPPQVRVN